MSSFRFQRRRRQQSTHSFPSQSSPTHSPVTITDPSPILDQTATAITTIPIPSSPNTTNYADLNTSRLPSSIPSSTDRDRSGGSLAYRPRSHSSLPLRAVALPASVSSTPVTVTAAAIDNSNNTNTNISTTTNNNNNANTTTASTTTATSISVPAQQNQQQQQQQANNNEQLQLQLQQQQHEESENDGERVAREYELKCFKYRFKIRLPARLFQLAFRVVLFIIFIACISFFVYQWRRHDLHNDWQKLRCSYTNVTIEPLSSSSSSSSDIRYRVTAQVYWVNISALTVPTAAYYGRNTNYNIKSLEKATSIQAKLQASSTQSICVVNFRNKNFLSLQTHIRDDPVSLAMWAALLLATALLLYASIVGVNQFVDRITVYTDRRRRIMQSVALARARANAEGNGTGGGRNGNGNTCLTRAQARFVCNVFGVSTVPGESNNRGGANGNGGVRDIDVLSSGGRGGRRINSSRHDHDGGDEDELELNIFHDATNENQEACAICLDSFAYSIHTPIVRLPCKHRFHRQCIRKWFRTGKPSCPLCQWDPRMLFDKKTGLPNALAITRRSAKRRRHRRQPQPQPQPPPQPQQVEDIGDSVSVIANGNGNGNGNATAAVGEDEDETEDRVNDEREQDVTSLSSTQHERFIQGVSTWRMLTDHDDESMSIGSTRVSAQTATLRRHHDHNDDLHRHRHHVLMNMQQLRSSSDAHNYGGEEGRRNDSDSDSDSDSDGDSDEVVDERGVQGEEAVAEGEDMVGDNMA